MSTNPLASKQEEGVFLEEGRNPFVSINTLIEHYARSAPLMSGLCILVIATAPFVTWAVIVAGYLVSVIAVLWWAARFRAHYIFNEYTPFGRKTTFLVAARLPLAVAAAFLATNPDMEMRQDWIAALAASSIGLCMLKDVFATITSLAASLPKEAA